MYISISTRLLQLAGRWRASAGKTCSHRRSIGEAAMTPVEAEAMRNIRRAIELVLEGCKESASKSRAKLVELTVNAQVPGASGKGNRVAWNEGFFYYMTGQSPLS